MKSLGTQILRRKFLQRNLVRLGIATGVWCSSMPDLEAGEQPPLAGPGKLPEVAVLMPGRVAYFDAQIVGMNAQASLAGLNLKYLFADWNAAAQIRQIAYTLSMAAQGLAICAVDSHALRVLPDLLRRSQRSDMPVVSFTNAIGDSPAGDFPGVTAYVGRDEVESGRLLGQMIRRVLPATQPARILLIEGAPGTTPQRLRTQGLREVVAAHPGWEIVHRFAVPGWSSSTAENELYRLEHLDVNIIATQWAEAGAAAARAMRRRPRPIPIVSLEYTRQLRPFLESGVVALTTTHDVRREGRLVIATMQEALQKKVPEPWVRIDQRIVDPLLARTLVPDW